MELDAGCDRDFETAIVDDGWVDVEVAVAADTPGFVCRDRVRHLVSRIASGRSVHVGSLVWRVVRQLVLEEVGAAAIAIPEHVVLLEVLDEQAVDRDIVPVDDPAIASRFDRPAYPCAAVRA